ncbi:alpha-hydroxy acid oxidase [Roseomonas chloroacetimidivorans]|uniref:alpha-hydroxy acid oxidase n=1 Tax=Roseomonas chloroacetimidivorans TaxID=1766656 RepID=UPI003C711842
MNPRHLLSLDDAERAARRRLPRGVFDYVAGWAETGAAFRANRAAFEELSFETRVLVDVSATRQSVELFGQAYASPFGIAPMGAAALCAREADLLLARAAAAEGIPFVLSGASCAPMEAVARAAPGSWYQAYLPANRAAIGKLLDRVERAGIEVLVVTADVPVAPNREDCLRRDFTMPVRPTARLVADGLVRPRWLAMMARTVLAGGLPRFENFGAERGGPIIAPPDPSSRLARAALSWADLGWIRERWGGQLVLKGVLSARDTRRAREAGVDAVIVSNHGGRQLDHAVAPIRILPAVVAAAGGMPVLLDGGVRRGTDVLKALALGARMVLVGRPMLFAAAVAGEAGVRRMAALLRAEVERNLALLGSPALAELHAGRIVAHPDGRRDEDRVRPHRERNVDA